jgi:RES domain-containing protein
MTHDPALVAFHGAAYRASPGDQPFEVDAIVSDDGDGDRWNRPGEPTIYLALDPGVALAEAGRHMNDQEGTQGCQLLVSLEIRVDGLVDLRDAAVRRDLGIEGGPAAFLDRQRARELAGRLRRLPDCRGILAPSMALIDQPARGNLVVFAEKLVNGPRDIVLGHEEVGRLEVLEG